MTACVACGKVEHPAVDAAEILDGAGDASPDGSSNVRCDPTKPFGTPEPVAELNSPADDAGARLTADELTVYFSSTRAGGAGAHDLYRATRATIDAPFSGVQRLAELASVDNDRDPSPTPDGSTLYFQRNADIFVSNAIGATFSTPMPVAVVNTAGPEQTPFVTASGLYLSSNGNIVFARRAPSGELLAPVQVSEVNTTAEEFDPVLDVAELTLFVGTRRAGSSSGDIWVARRPSPQDAFSAPTVVGEISDPIASEGATWLSADGCVLYTESNAAGDANIYVARRPR